MVSIKKLPLRRLYRQPFCSIASYNSIASRRLLFLIIFLSLISILSHAQKIQIKKGLITNDGEPLGKLEGEATFANGTDITIKSMGDEPLVHIKCVIINYHNVFYKSIQFYSIDFIPLNQSAALTMDYPFSSEKRLIEYLYATIGPIFLSKEGLNKNQVENFLASKDESAKIHADTTHNFAMRNNEREALKKSIESRDINGMLLMRLVDSRASGSSTQETAEIYQGNLLIGKIVKTITSSAVASGGSPVRSASYVVMRRVEAFSVDGEKFEFAHLAAVNADPNFPLDIKAYCERTWAKDLKLSDILAGERQIILWLIEKGCL